MIKWIEINKIKWIEKNLIHIYTPNQLNQNLWGWAQVWIYFLSSLGNSNKKQKLGTTSLIHILLDFKIDDYIFYYYAPKHIFYNT